MTIASDFPHVAVNEQKGEPVKDGYAHFRVVPARYPLRTAGTVLSVLIIAAILHSVFGNPAGAGTCLRNGSLPNRCLWGSAGRCC